MALSNIFREPRREITESLIGVTIFAVPLYWDYRLTLAVNATSPHPLPVPVGMLILGGVVIVIGLIGWGAALLTHFIGEEICDSLARRGLELRPKERRRVY
jgi:hypothetical protein